MGSRRLPLAYNVSTYGNATRDYTSLSTWESATDNDLVTAQAGEVLDCYEDASPYNDGGCYIAGATTNASYFRVVRKAPSVSRTYDPTSGVVFSCAGYPDIIYCGESYDQVQDITMINTYTSGTAYACYMLAGNAAVVGCFAKSVNGAETGRGIRLANGALAINCVVYECDGWSIYVSGGTCYCYYCTSVDNRDGYVEVSAGVAKNCISEDNAVEDFWGGDWTLTTCAEQEGIAFSDQSNDDYRLASADGTGTDLTSDIVYPVDDDLLGNPRDPSAPDRGAFEHTTSGGAYVDLAGAIAVTPQLAAALKKYVGMSGTAQITAGASCGMRAIRGIQGNVDTRAQAEAALRMTRGIQGNVSAQAQAAATMKPVRGIAGSIDARAELEAYARVYRALIGTVAAQAGMGGALSLSGVIDLAGSIDAAGNMAANMRVILGLAGQVDGAVNMTGAVRPFRNISGAMAAVAELAGAAMAIRGISGGVEAAADITGHVKVDRELAGSIAGTVDVSGGLGLTLSFSGSIDALAELLGALSTFIPSTLGDPIDLTIESVTPQRETISITIKRTITEV